MASPAALASRDKLLHPSMYGRFDLYFSNDNVQELGWLAWSKTSASTREMDIPRSVITELWIHTHFVGSEQGNTRRYLLGECSDFGTWTNVAKAQRAEGQLVAATGPAANYTTQVNLLKTVSKTMHTRRMQAMSNFESPEVERKLKLFIELSANALHLPLFPLTPLFKVVEKYDDLTNLGTGDIITTQPSALDWVLRKITCEEASAIRHVECQFWIDLSMPTGMWDYPFDYIPDLVLNLSVLKLRVGGMWFGPGRTNGREWLNEGYRVVSREELQLQMGPPATVPERSFLPRVIREALSSGFLREFELSSTKAMPNFESFYSPAGVPAPPLPPIVNGLTQLKLENLTIDDMTQFHGFINTMQSLRTVHFVNLQGWDRRPFPPGTMEMLWEDVLSLFALPIPPVPVAAPPPPLGFPALAEVNIQGLTVRRPFSGWPTWIPWSRTAVQPSGIMVAGGVVIVRPFPVGTAMVHSRIRARFAGMTGGLIAATPAIAFAPGVPAVIGPPYIAPTAMTLATPLQPARPRYWFH